MSTRLIDAADSSLPATSQSTGYHKRQLQEDLFNFRFLRNMNIGSTELFSDIHTLHKAMKQIRINSDFDKVQSWMNHESMFELILNLTARTKKSVKVNKMEL